jgi:hypothetical protein
VAAAIHRIHMVMGAVPCQALPRTIRILSILRVRQEATDSMVAPDHLPSAKMELARVSQATAPVNTEKTKQRARPVKGRVSTTALLPQTCPSQLAVPLLHTHPAPQLDSVVRAQRTDPRLLAPAPRATVTSLPATQPHQACCSLPSDIKVRISSNDTILTCSLIHFLFQ